MKHTYKIIAMMLLILFILSGCLYPSSQLEKNQTPNQAQLDMVQSALNDYQEKTNGLLPIRTKPNETPIFEKYIIDFNQLKEQGSLAEVPGNAYENGGIYQYAIINPDTNPEVKLIDLRITDALRSINLKINLYRDKNLYPPFGEVVENGIFTIDHEKLGLETPPTIESPYSDAVLPIVMDTDGNIYIDYRIDLNNALKEYNSSYKEGEDIRFLLAENTPFLPVYSLPYTVKDNEPVFMTE
ncbi:hypothetical protein H8S33_09690 [Ornithinibacillus sp. BX22]|uniref:Uncharacterized protein n=2 Tax=Ornithinibacillus TaxID=484508 RepID=A0A923L5W9_9BACI|nr:MULTISPECIES: hypothetical protein [Ornithinibacillus]MBC5637077.1 hypothetical protein [Ornithinibacillus hominis]MBS3679712.1 hypothetical protein [Ornithinibacillus massiliensis]